MTAGSANSRIVRRATADDLAVVASWIGSSRECADWAGWRVSFPIDMASLPNAIEFQHGNAFAVEDRRGLAAFGQLIEKSKDRVHLARLIVDPGRRRQGHGELLVHELLTRARRSGFARASLNVSEENAPGLLLYRKAGFRRAERPADEPMTIGSLYMELPTA